MRIVRFCEGTSAVTGTSGGRTYALVATSGMAAKAACSTTWDSGIQESHSMAAGGRAAGGRAAGSKAAGKQAAERQGNRKQGGKRQ